MEVSSRTPQTPSTEKERPNEWEEFANETKESCLKRHSPPLPTPAAMLEFLKDAKLPSPLELAKIAAAVGPRENSDEAIRNAAWLYLRAIKFRESFRAAKPEQRAALCGQYEVLCESETAADQRVSLGPVACGKVTDFASFLKWVVAVKNPCDSAKRLRDYFRDQCPKSEDADTFAFKMFEHYKSADITESEWQELADVFEDWWKKRRSNSARKSASHRK